jgi:molybdopterin molybdotransferase
MTIALPIGNHGCGCDSAIARKGLVSIDTALERIASGVTPLGGVEEVPLARAAGRVLAHPLKARANTPPFDSAAMDGYALSLSDLPGAGPWHLQIAARVAAGQSGPALPPGTVARIFTGAPLPEAADAVIMQEEVTLEGGAVCIIRRPQAGESIRRAGEDMQQGAEVLSKGTLLGPREIAVAAAAGHGSVPVCRRIRTALLVTGSEVQAAGQSLGDAAIWDINTPVLTACLSIPSLELVAVETATDDPTALVTQVEALAARADLLVTTGGISVGEADFVKPVFERLGGKTLFSGVAMKPGKPVSAGRIDRATWLGLPGNPVSALLTWQLFGTEILRRLGGQKQSRPVRRHVVLADPIHRKPGRCELRPAQICGFDAQGREVVRFDGATHSARVAGLPCCDGVLMLPAETDQLPQGALVEFLPFHCN